MFTNLIKLPKAQSAGITINFISLEQENLVSLKIAR